MTKSWKVNNVPDISFHAATNIFCDTSQISIRILFKLKSYWKEEGEKKLSPIKMHF